MDVEAYIESGILELYVAGALSEKENQEVYNLMQQHPEILQEVLEIENAIITLTSSTSRGKNKKLLDTIKSTLGFNENDGTKEIPVRQLRYNWVTYTGWAAAIILGVGLFWTLNQNKQLESDIQTADIENSYLELQIEQAKSSLSEANSLISVLRDENIKEVPLAGQANFENSYAKVYWDEDNNRIYLDAAGLPEPPRGKVYQVWSLTLNPLTPISLGTLDNFQTDDNKIFEIENLNQSEAFGITLEPEGGSASPTMEQLYTLGVV